MHTHKANRKGSDVCEDSRSESEVEKTSRTAEVKEAAGVARQLLHQD